MGARLEKTKKIIAESKKTKAKESLHGKQKETQRERPHFLQ